MSPHSEDPIELPVTDVFDLHSIPPRDAKAAVEAYLDEANARGFRAVRIIHGRGIGVQREMVRKVLSAKAYVQSYGDAPVEAGGWGATVAMLGEALLDPCDVVLHEFDDTLQAVERITAQLSPAEFHWRESPDKWSVGQSLDHLAKVGRMYADKMLPVIQAGQEQGMKATAPFQPGLLERLFLWSTEPPPKFRVTAPKVFRPAGPDEPTGSPEELVAAYRKANRTFYEMAKQTRDLDWNRLKVSSPATDKIRISLGASFAIAAAHERRHIYQMEGIVKAGGLGRTPR